MKKSLIYLIAVSLWLLACSDSSSEPQKEEYDISGCCSGEWTIERIISINSLGDTINIRNGDSTYTNKGVCNPPPPSVMTFMCAETPFRFVDSVVIDSSISTQNGTQTDKADATDSIQTLEAFLEKYDITDYSFDKNVLAYNETSGYCDALQNTCFEAPGIGEFRTLGLHRFEANDITALTTIFPHAAAAMNNKIEGCPLYVLNISDTSPAIHILTNITKDTITIVNISDECAYEPRPFDMNVGFLFTYCDELSENPEVVTTQVFDDKMECGTIEYAEYISEKHTNEAFMADMRKAQAEFKKLKAAAKPSAPKTGKK
ncbi:MAG: hypothetical protein IKH55_03180 [Fibrobacter sp.]|nr:hypothetical protein [Fibrobacter sp.]